MIAKFVTGYILELDTLEEKKQTLPFSKELWKAPEGATIIINFDGAFDGQRLRSASRWWQEMRMGGC